MMSGIWKQKKSSTKKLRQFIMLEIDLTCPNCGAPLEINLNIEKVFAHIAILNFRYIGN